MQRGMLLSLTMLQSATSVNAKWTLAPLWLISSSRCHPALRGGFGKAVRNGESGLVKSACSKVGTVAVRGRKFAQPSGVCGIGFARRTRIVGLVRGTPALGQATSDCVHGSPRARRAACPQHRAPRLSSWATDKSRCDPRWWKLRLVEPEGKRRKKLGRPRPVRSGRDAAESPRTLRARRVRPLWQRTGSCREGTTFIPPIKVGWPCQNFLRSRDRADPLRQVDPDSERCSEPLLLGQRDVRPTKWPKSLACAASGVRLGQPKGCGSEPLR